jgi:hypothetical protein
MESFKNVLSSLVSSREVFASDLDLLLIIRNHSSSYLFAADAVEKGEITSSARRALGTVAAAALIALMKLRREMVSARTAASTFWVATSTVA